MTTAPADLGVALQGPISNLPTLAERLERAGTATIWVGDYFQAGLIRAAVVAQATSRCRVGTHVLQTFARSPLATALAAQELQELAGGRFVLGLGSQFPEANRRWHGVAHDRPVAALAEYIAAVRALLAAPAGEAVAFAGARFSYRVPAFRPDAATSPAPIWVGGAGAATVAMAARTADGMAGHLLWTYAHARDTVRPVLDRLPLSVPRLVAPAPGEPALYRRLAHYLATPGYEQFLRLQGTPVDRDALRAALGRGDDAALKGLVGPHAAAWCIRTAEDLARHRAEAAAHGVDQLVLLVPAEPADPAGVAAYEQTMVGLVEAAAGQPTAPFTRKVC